MPSFTIQKGFENTREGLSVIEYCLGDKSRQYKIKSEPIAGWIPVGSVEFCEKLIYPRPTGSFVNFYPKFLGGYHGRQIKLCDDHYIKPAGVWKTDEGNRPMEPSYIAERIKFCNEWRLYVANGTLRAVGWYKGEDEDAPFPMSWRFEKWPPTFSGAVDFGETRDRIELVESHPPYACGWYAEREGHAPWLIDAWESFLKYQHMWWFTKEDPNYRW